MKKVLITGGAGFIGSHLVERNLDLGNRVRVFDLPGNPRLKEYETKGVEITCGDIRDRQAVDQATRGVELVFHLAALVTDWADWEQMRQINVEGTRNACAASLRHGVERFVAASTNDVFGIGEGVLIDESHGFQRWGACYPDTKIEAAEIIREQGKKGLPFSIVYPCWVYGPGDRTFVPLVADAIRKGELLFWRKDVTVWPAFVGNVVDLMMRISGHPDAVGQGFLVHDGESDTFQNFSARIASVIGCQAPSLTIPYWSAGLAACIMETAWKLLGKKSRPLLTRYSVKNLGSRLRFSIEKAEKLLAWHPPFSYEEGFLRTMAWLKQSDPSLWKQK